MMYVWRILYMVCFLWKLLGKYLFNHTAYFISLSLHKD
jgi:hypothetical protein